MGSTREGAVIYIDSDLVAGHGLNGSLDLVLLSHHCLPHRKPQLSHEGNLLTHLAIVVNISDPCIGAGTTIGPSYRRSKLFLV